jgi:ribosomal protein S18 acetylase RimI-like enzyme
MDIQLPHGYSLRKGEARDRALLVKFLRHTYKELFPYQQHFVHLIKTVDDYFSRETPLWWIEITESMVLDQVRTDQVACLWMGNGIDQVSGDRYSHIFLLYVIPEYRRQGLGKALMNQAINYAQDRGDRQIGLQVFTHNQQALKLYQSFGFQTQSFLMFKSIDL